MKTSKSAILITGAGSGIGRAMAQIIALHNPNTNLVLCGRNIERLQKTQSMLSGKSNHHIVQLDLTKHESIKEIKSYLNKNNLTLSSLILNAGIGGENIYGANDRWDEIIATNLTGPYLLTQELIPFLKASPESYKKIVFISSILARVGVPKYAAYCSSKAGLLGLMRSFANELASDKILVNAICPGWVETEMTTRGLNDIAAGTNKTPEEVRVEQMSYVPLQKMSTAEEIAEFTNFLISDLQTSITGQTIDINNGAIMPC